MATALGEAPLLQLLQGVRRLDLEVQGLKVRVSRLEGQMDRLEMSNGQILEHIQRIERMLTEPSKPVENTDGLVAYLDAIERRLLAVKR